MQSLRARFDAASRDLDNQLASLHEARATQELMRDIEEAEAWTAEKMQAALEESYADPSNLQGKKDTHDAFMAELQAHEAVLEGIKSRAAALAVPLPALDRLLQRHADLLEAADVKSKRLGEAHQQLLFNRRVEDLELWCSEMEASLLQGEAGHGLRSVTRLLKKHDLLEANVEAQRGHVRDIAELAAQLSAAGHFQRAAILQKKDEVERRFESLQAPMAARREDLQRALEFHRFGHAVQDLESWLKEKVDVLGSADLGQDKDLRAVQTLQRMHQQLKEEIMARQDDVAAVVAKGAALVGDGHPQAADIDSRATRLNHDYEDLLTALGGRGEKLAEAAQVCHFMDASNDVLEALFLKEPQATSKEYGKDSAATAELRKRHAVVVDEVAALDSSIADLASCVKQMHDEGVGDREAIAARLEEVEVLRAELAKALDKRQIRLDEMAAYHLFVSSFEETRAWIDEKTASADSKVGSLDEGGGG